jgi:predicted outer membrane repeat protein
VYRGASPSFVDCTFIDNTTQVFGGAIAGGAAGTTPPDFTIDECTFVGNHADYMCGAVALGFGAHATISHCTFEGNTAGALAGAAGTGFNSSATVVECTFIGNSAAAGGAYGAGAQPGDASTATLTSCTIYGEDGVGGSVSVGSPEASIVLEKTIIAFSVAGPAVGGGVASQYTLSCCDIYGNAGGDYVGPIAGMLGVDNNICQDPLLCAPYLFDFSVCSISQCTPEYNPDCGQIGAWPVGCYPPCGVTSVGEGTADTSWGAVKSFYK